MKEESEQTRKQNFHLSNFFNIFDEYEWLKFCLNGFFDILFQIYNIYI